MVKDNTKMGLKNKNYKTIDISQQGQTSPQISIGGQQSFYDLKKKDSLSLNLDFLKNRVRVPSRQRGEQEPMKKPESRENSKESREGGAHQKNFDIFLGGRFTGPRELDYNSMQKLCQLSTNTSISVR